MIATTANFLHGIRGRCLHGAIATVALMAYAHCTGLGQGQRTIVFYSTRPGPSPGPVQCV